jgi:hypothetical protein
VTACTVTSNTCAAGGGNSPTTAATAIGDSYAPANAVFGAGKSRLKTQLQFAQAPGKTTSLNVKDFTNEGIYGFLTAVAGGATTTTTNAIAGT